MLSLIIYPHMYPLIEVIQIIKSLKNMMFFLIYQKRDQELSFPSPLKIYQYRLQINCTQPLLHCD